MGGDPREIHLGETGGLPRSERQRIDGEQLQSRHERLDHVGHAYASLGGVSRGYASADRRLQREYDLQESANLQITELIYDGGRTIAAIRSAKEADIAGRATLLRNLQTLALNVANAYYAVLEDNATV